MSGSNFGGGIGGIGASGALAATGVPFGWYLLIATTALVAGYLILRISLRRRAVRTAGAHSA
ncbi:peptidase [Compostimonas suwonensis]|uniref:LPXTG-motif cell wall-anchored protein n=1 Tax=Compostimonas suwonensis TaxID=1048394 RepID=A0A2M9BUA7_9MICO|nr:peptidase [Compostimonas suwonensis]PJJ61534.1 hypothetical protein CLV54_2479 [Compostimonas suwonensis]